MLRGRQIISSGRQGDGMRPRQGIGFVNCRPQRALQRACGVWKRVPGAAYAVAWIPVDSVTRTVDGEILRS